MEKVPPLGERREDIIPLARHLLQQITQDFSLPEIKIDPQAEKALMGYDWPGNVRELRNVLERVLFSIERDTIYLCDLPFYLYRNQKNLTNLKHSALKNILESAEKEALRHALAATNYNKVRAAALLGIHRTLLYKKLKKYNLIPQKGGDAR